MGNLASAPAVSGPYAVRLRAQTLLQSGSGCWISISFGSISDRMGDMAATAIMLELGSNPAECGLHSLPRHRGLWQHLRLHTHSRHRLHPEGGTRVQNRGGLRAGHDLEQLPEHLQLQLEPASLLLIGCLTASTRRSSDCTGKTGTASTGAQRPPDKLSIRCESRWPAEAGIASPAARERRVCRGALGKVARVLPTAVLQATVTSAILEPTCTTWCL